MEVVVAIHTVYTLHRSKRPKETNFCLRQLLLPFEAFDLPIQAANVCCSQVMKIVKKETTKGKNLISKWSYGLFILLLLKISAYR